MFVSRLASRFRVVPVHRAGGRYARGEIRAKLVFGGGAILLAGAAAWGQLPGAPSTGDPDAAAEDSNYLPQILMVAGIVVIALTITRLARRRVPSGGDHRAPPRERLEAIKTGAETRAAREHSEGLIEPVTAAAELAVMLDNRAIRVEQLIRDADDRLARLERTGATAEPGPDGGTLRDPESPTDDDTLRGDAERIHERAAADCDPSAIARELNIPLDEVRRVLATGPSPSPPPPPTPPPTPTPTPPSTPTGDSP